MKLSSTFPTASMIGFASFGPSFAPRACNPRSIRASSSASRTSFLPPTSRSVVANRVRLQFRVPADELRHARQKRAQVACLRDVREQIGGRRAARPEERFRENDIGLFVDALLLGERGRVREEAVPQRDLRGLLQHHVLGRALLQHRDQRGHEVRVRVEASRFDRGTRQVRRVERLEDVQQDRALLLAPLRPARKRARSARSVAPAEVSCPSRTSRTSRIRSPSLAPSRPPR